MTQAKKKQKFFDVDIPLIKKETQLYAYDLEDLEERSIKYDLTRSLRGKSALLTLKVKVDKEKATSYPTEIRVLPSFTRRMVRKGTDYVEDSFIIQTKDSKVRIKPLLITRKKVSKVVRKALREAFKKEIEEYSKKKKIESMFEEILKNQVQKTISLKLKKIYPLSLCEIRVFKREEK